MLSMREDKNGAFRCSHAWQGEPREIYKTKSNPKCFKTLKCFQNSKYIKMYLSIRIRILGVGCYYKPYFK